MTELTDSRKQKDQFFAADHHSPLTPQQKESFAGLKYFPENPALRLELEIEVFTEQDQVEMQTSTGDLRTYTRYGRIHFEVNGEAAALTIFASEHGFFLPFVDTQAGKLTYGAGRYLDPPAAQNGKLSVDFNLAYNPYCAYNENYSCPLPPAENRLKVAIQAGEQNFK